MQVMLETRHFRKVLEDPDDGATAPRHRNQGLSLELQCFRMLCCMLSSYRKCIFVVVLRNWFLFVVMCLFSPMFNMATCIV